MADYGYEKLDVYRLAHDLAVRIHRMTLTLPGFEKYEEGSQVRRSSKRVSSSIVEGYALRKYKALFLSYLFRGLGSADETREHPKYLIETGSLVDEKVGRILLKDAEEVSRKLTRFIQSVERQHGVPFSNQKADSLVEDVVIESPGDELSPPSAIRNPQSAIKGKTHG